MTGRRSLRQLLTDRLGKQGLYDTPGYWDMKAEEYDAFIEDPADFIVRKFWPRAFSQLKVFGQLAPLNSVTDHFGAQFFFAPFGLP